MTPPLWQRFSNLSPEVKETLHQEMIALARKLGREAAKVERPRRCADDYHDDENDYDKAYHGGWL